MSVNLISQLKDIQTAIREKSVVLFLDFDGTLSTIVSDPSKAQLLPRARDLLSELVKTPGIYIAVVSGRALVDVRSRVGIEGIVYVGNHGLEIEGPDISLTVQVPQEFRTTLSDILREVDSLSTRFSGLFIEKKGFGASLHFRAVSPELLIPLNDVLLKLLLPYQCAQRVRVTRGKMVLDVQPPVLCNKGTAVVWLLDQWFARERKDSVSVFYFGDDATDEHAFQALPSSAITVKVGFDPESAAAYYVSDEIDVVLFLDMVLRMRRELSV
jgi:trehalose 6-phosphate phosphatase